LGIVQKNIQHLRERNNDLSDQIDAIESENIKLEKECQGGKFIKQEIYPEEERIRKIEHIILTTISRNSSKLACMMSDRCDSEMNRTRRIDRILTEQDSLLQSAVKQLQDIKDYRIESQRIRAQYDEQLEADFRDLIELGLTVETLQAEVVNAQRQRRQQQHTITPHDMLAPIIDSTNEIRERVKVLSEQVESERMNAHAAIKSLQDQLGRTRQNKQSVKKKFQSEIKSLFTDFKSLHDRLDRAEKNLEKTNTHYDLDEEEIVNVISPIIDSLDAVREEIDAIADEAENFFYNSPAPDGG